MISIGLILHKEFLSVDRWNCPLSYYFIQELMEQFDCKLIHTQEDYDNVTNINAILHISPGFSSAKINYRNRRIPSYMILSDFHSEKWREDYFIENNINYILTFYPSPAKFHFKKIDAKKIIPFFWSVPDQITSYNAVRHDLKYISIFGASNHEAYETREWCKYFDFVHSCDNSGVENKKYTAQEYYQFLRSQDAIIAAGSLNDNYKMLLPKYFEIASQGALLFAQENDDLQEAGFIDGYNCIIFNKENFEIKAKKYLQDTDNYREIREQGINLIRERHTTAVRVQQFKDMIWKGLGRL